MALEAERICLVLGSHIGARTRSREERKTGETGRFKTEVSAASRYQGKSRGKKRLKDREKNVRPQVKSCQAQSLKPWRQIT